MAAQNELWTEFVTKLRLSPAWACEPRDIGDIGDKELVDLFKELGFTASSQIVKLRTLWNRNRTGTVLDPWEQWTAAQRDIYLYVDKSKFGSLEDATKKLKNWVEADIYGSIPKEPVLRCGLDALQVMYAADSRVIKITVAATTKGPRITYDYEPFKQK